MLRKMISLVLALMTVSLTVVPAMAMAEDNKSEAFYLLVAEVDEETGEVYGWVLGNSLSESKEQGFGQDMYLYKEDARIPFEWSSCSEGDGIAVFEASTLLVEPGDVISNYVTDSWHTIVCGKLPDGKVRLYFPETDEELYPYYLQITREDQEEYSDVAYEVLVNGVPFGMIESGESLYVPVESAEAMVVVRTDDPRANYPGRKVVLVLPEGRVGSYLFELGESGSIARDIQTNIEAISNDALD